MATFSILTITLFATLKKCAMKNHGNISNHGNNSINLREMEKPQKQVFSRLFWRKRWDSNPRYLAVHRISSEFEQSIYRVSKGLFEDSQESKKSSSHRALRGLDPINSIFLESHTISLKKRPISPKC